MTQVVSAQLIALCESILEDGEVSVDEVRRLRDWLDQHENERACWPGEIIADPVHAILADDRVTKTELRKVGALLRRVHREWVARRQESARQEAIATTARTLSELDLSLARLPSIPQTLRVRSHTEKDLVYDVDLTGPSCSCPDWTTQRSHLPVGDLSRCCKHVFDAFARTRPSDGWPEWLEAYFAQGWRPHPRTRWKVLNISGRFVLASTAPVAWANVFAPVASYYQRFGYSVVERRWSYGEEPDGAFYIANAIVAGLPDVSLSELYAPRPFDSGRGDGFLGKLRRFFGG